MEISLGSGLHRAGRTLFSLLVSLHLSLSLRAAISPRVYEALLSFSWISLFFVSWGRGGGRRQDGHVSGVSSRQKGWQDRKWRGGGGGGSVSDEDVAHAGDPGEITRVRTLWTLVRAHANCFI